MSGKYMDMLSKKHVLSNKGKYELDFYEHCVMGKQKRKPFGVEIYSFKEFLEYIHFDV
jgi:hypothetical protein